MIARTVLLPAAVALLLVASGCAATSTGARLVDAKSMVQLVRNEAGSRVPADVVAHIQLLSDASEACASESDDPRGTQRRWASSSVVTLVDGGGDSLEPAFLALIESFSANGWSEVSYGGDGAVSLKKPGGDASLGLVAQAEDATSGSPASISISISSGCVMTAGEGSEEVTLLESVGS